MLFNGSQEVRAKRFPFQLQVKYRGLGEKRWHGGITDNVSCSGMLVRGPRVFSPAAKVEVMLTLPRQLAGDANLVALCNGEVARTVDRKLPPRHSTLGIRVVACELFKGKEPIGQGAPAPHANKDLPAIVQGLYEMLEMIVGSSEILISETPAGGTAKQHAAFIRKAAARATALLDQIST